MDEGAFDIAAHDARERDMQHIHGLATGRACQSHGLATERRKLDENPKRYDQGKTYRYARVHHAGADGDHARGALTRHVGRRRSHGGQGFVHVRLHRVVLEHVGIASIHAVGPAHEVVDVAGDALYEVGELLSKAERRGEHEEADESQHGNHEHIGDPCSRRARDALGFQLVHRAAEAEHDDQRPEQDADRDAEDIDKVDRCACK